MARQVNHDIKNGLIPIRNVLRHLGEVAEHERTPLADAFRERRTTLDASVGYLDTLARNYAKLTPRTERIAVDVNAVVREAVAATAIGATGTVTMRLAPALPRVEGDPVVLRRIMDNLLRNGIESLDGKGGGVTVTTAGARGDGVHIVIADTGRGMDQDGIANAFADFYTTKPDGTGLGLSVVRRLVSDLGGNVQIASTPGVGTSVTVELPA
jgi:signal transduction histidine kinase